MGMLVARAIIDERILDFPLNSLFWDLILERPVFLEDLKKMDKSLGSTIISLQELLNKKKEIESDRNLVASQKKEQIKRITLNVYINFTIISLSFLKRELLWSRWISLLFYQELIISSW